jgi:hypothetical protein
LAVLEAREAMLSVEDVGVLSIPEGKTIVTTSVSPVSWISTSSSRLRTMAFGNSDSSSWM